jgi:hypothetical protein
VRAEPGVDATALAGDAVAMAVVIDDGEGG